MMYRVSHHPLVPGGMSGRTFNALQACERNVVALSDLSRPQVEARLLANARASGRVRFDLTLVRLAKMAVSPQLEQV